MCSGNFQVQEKIFFCSFLFCVLQQADVENSALGFRPSFPDLFDYFCLIIDTMVINARKLNRVEHMLFEAVEDMEMQYLSSVSVAEELVERAKERIHTVIAANSHGPIKSVEFCSLLCQNQHCFCTGFGD